MPSSLRVGSEVSCKCSKFARLLPLQGTQKRRTRERVYGVCVKSLPNRKWQVKWASGDLEDVLAGNLKEENQPSRESIELANLQNGIR